MGSIPVILSRPYVGVIVWSWLGYMNPHRLAWGFAASFPFAQIVAITTVIAMLFSKEPKRIPWSREVVVLTIFLLWMCITTITALEPDRALMALIKVLKVQFMTYVTLMLMVKRERLHMLVWTIALSIGFFGVKGGIFTILTGGNYLVWGPDNSFIAGNNGLAVAMLMILPLFYYLSLQDTRKLVRSGIFLAMFFTMVAILGTHSRGALLGVVAVVLFLIIKSEKRVGLLLSAFIILPLILTFMPDAWWERMGTIQTYEEDASAMGRINSWWFAFNLASDRIMGGGFEPIKHVWFIIYAPDPDDLHDFHSIYFQVLGEHGFIGLGLFLLLGGFTWRTATWVISKSRGIDELKWASDLCRALQVSLVAYIISGAFLELAYFDFYYHIVVMIVICKVLVNEELTKLGGLSKVQNTSINTVRSTYPAKAMSRTDAKL